jgi:arylsulfatase A-like enzyme
VGFFIGYIAATNFITVMKNTCHKIVSLALICVAYNTAIAQSKPNIVYIMADEWRAQATGYAGDPNVKTPNLDKLSKESVNFSNAVSVLPVCTPYRAALLTGRYPQHTGMFLNDLSLPASELTLAEIFKSAGYNTGYIGKWHLDGHGRQSYIPADRRQGFDYWHANECTHNYNHSRYFINDDTTAHFYKGYDAYGQTEDAVAYIKEHAKQAKPFVLMIGFGGPHFPNNEAPENLKKRYNEQTIKLRPNVPKDMEAEARKEAVGYYAHCTAIDSCVGIIRNMIASMGIDNNTIFVFTSDHGEMLGSQDVHPDAKQRPWDEAIKVPFLLRYPALAANRSITIPLNSPDILPTLLSLSGIPKPATVEGDDLSGLVTGKQKMNDRAALIVNIAPFAEGFTVKEFRGLRTTRYTYVRTIEGPWLLYDNQTDPFQLTNLVNSPAQKAVQDKLDKELNAKLTALGDEFKPKDYYLKTWGYKVTAKKGEIPYGPGPYAGQGPNLQK